MDDDEIVCNCMNVTVKDIKDAINNGAKSFEEVQEATQASTACGACEDSIRELVDKLIGA